MSAVSNLCESIFHAMLLLSLKAALLAPLAWLLNLLLRRHVSPAWRHALWLIVFVRLCVPDLASFRWSLDRLTPVSTPPALTPQAPPPAPLVENTLPPVIRVSPAPPHDSTVLPPELSPSPGTMIHAAPTKSGEGAPPHASLSLWQVLSMIWAAGTFATLSLMASGYLRLRKLLRRGVPAPEDWQTLHREACALAGVAPPPLIVTEVVKAPAVFGLWRPRVLLPSKFAGDIEKASLRLALLHELAHVRRRDLWIQSAAALLTAVHWFNPMVWLAGRRLRMEAELAADAAVLRWTGSGEAHRFGEMLLGLASRAVAGWALWLTVPALCSIAENKTDLRRRVEALLDLARGRRGWWALGCVVFLGLAASGLTQAPPAKKDADILTPAGPNVTVAGLVQDENGRPIAGAKCNLHVEDTGDSDSYQETRSDQAGRFSFKAIPPHVTIRVWVTHPDYAEDPAIYTPMLSDKATDCRITLPTLTWVTGRVVRKTDTVPLKDVRVYLGSTSEPNYSVRFNWADEAATTDASGRYRLRNVHPKSRNRLVRFEAPGLASLVIPFTMDKQEVTLNAALEPDPGFTGKVVNAEGRPVANALVWVVEEQANFDSWRPVNAEWMEKQMSGRWVAQHFAVNKARTDTAGEFHLKTVPALLRDYSWIMALDIREGIQRVAVRNVKSSVELRLAPWNTLAGRITLPGGAAAPKVPIIVDLHTVEEDAGDPRLMQKSLLCNQTMQTIAGADGSYRLEHLLPMSYVSRIDIAGQRKDIPVLLDAGRTKTLDFTIMPPAPKPDPRDFRAVVGKIEMPKGFEGRTGEYTLHVQVMQQPRDLNSTGDSGPLDAQGGFVTRPLAPGRYGISVQVSSEGKRDFPQDVILHEFTLEPDAHQKPYTVPTITLKPEAFRPVIREVNLPLPKGPVGIATLHAVDDQSEPVQGAKVEVLSILDVKGHYISLKNAADEIPPTATDEKGIATLRFKRDLPGDIPAAALYVCVSPKDGSHRFVQVGDGSDEVLVCPRGCRIDATLSRPVTVTDLGSAIPANTVVSVEPMSADIWTKSFTSDTSLHLPQAMSRTGEHWSAMTSLQKDEYMMIAATMPDQSWSFSPVLPVTAKSGGEMQVKPPLAAGVVIEGRIEGLPPGFKGDAWATAEVTLSPVAGQTPGIGNEDVTWNGWVPVTHEGVFRIPGVPRGRLTLAAFGDGWLSRDPTGLGAEYSTDLGTAPSVIKLVLRSQPCVQKHLRILLPDGKPATGAVVRLSGFSLPNCSSLLFGPSREVPEEYQVRPEDAEAFARFCNTHVLHHVATADAQGNATLINLPYGVATAEVLWKNPATGGPEWEQANIHTGPGTEDPQIIKMVRTQK